MIRLQQTTDMKKVRQLAESNLLLPGNQWWDSAMGEVKIYLD